MSRPAWFGNEPDIIITARKNRALAKRRKERDEQAKGSAMTQDTENPDMVERVARAALRQAMDEMGAALAKLVNEAPPWEGYSRRSASVEHFRAHRAAVDVLIKYGFGA